MMTFLQVLFLILLVCKVIQLSQMSWWWVYSPAIIYVTLNILNNFRKKTPE